MASTPTIDVDFRYAAYPEVRCDSELLALNVRLGLALLVYLVDTGRPAPRSQLASLLWPDADPQTGRARLRRLCYKINAQAGAELVGGDAEKVWLSPQARTGSDVGRVRNCALQLMERTHESQSRASLDVVCAPTAACFLDGFDSGSDLFDAWASERRSDLDRLVQRALAHIGGALCALSQPALAAEAGQALLRLDPMAEAGHTTLLAARGQLGDAAGVEAAYFAYAELLRHELGIRPSAAVEAAYAQARGRLSSQAAVDLQLASGPPVRFAQAEDGAVAYLELGLPGARWGTMIVLFGMWSHLEVAWETPGIRAALERLSQNFRVVLMDRRGTGLSERLGVEPTVPAGAGDVDAVRRALGEEQVWLFGNAIGGSIALEYAALRPGNVQGVVLYAASAKGSAAPDYPWSASAEQLNEWVERLRTDWGQDKSLAQFAPSVAHLESAQAWWSRLLRQSASRNSIPQVLQSFVKMDVRDRLPMMQAPVLVLQREGDRIVRAGAARHLAEQLPNAQLRMLPGDDHLMWFGDTDGVIQALEDFVGARQG